MYQDILLSVDDRIATIAINRPQERNAFTEKMTVIEIRDAVEKCAADDDVSVIVITGTGAAFSSGGNIKSFKELIDSETYLQEEHIFAAGAAAKAIRMCPKPVIAAVNGPAFGAACSLACACDFRVMTESSKMSMAFINMGLSGDTGAVYYLERLVGLGRAADLMMTGRVVGGKEAFDIGLCTRLAEEGSLMEAAYKLARELAGRSLFAIAQQKAVINEFFYNEIDRFTQREADTMTACSRNPDFKEAVYAFLEKRPAEFNKK